MPTHLTSRFEKALVFASQLHREQRRKGSDVPYVSHLLAVAALVIEHGGDEDEAIAALLHDAIEDQGGLTARDGILRRFGERVDQNRRGLHRFPNHSETPVEGKKAGLHRRDQREVAVDPVRLRRRQAPQCA